MKFKFFSFVAVILFLQTAQALPLPTKALTELPLSFTADYNFDGILGLNNCSGSLIRFENSKDTDAAMVLTNGHCFEGGFAEPGSYTAGVASSRGFSILNAAGTSVGMVQAVQVLYSTMTKTDITLYKLDMSFADLATKYGVHALTLSSHHPELNQPIEVISGYWHRGYGCSIEAFIPKVREDKWEWEDSIRYSRPGCEIIGGTSGSPILLKGTRTVIGINNTKNESGEECAFDNPCEVDEQGRVSYTQGYAYGQETYVIYSCLNSNNEIDLHTKGCQLQH